MHARLSRRTVALVGPVSLVTFGRSAGSFAQTPSASPAGRPNDITSLEQRIAVTTPADLIATLGDSTIESPLFPADVGPLQIAPWQDDADVEGAQGAFQIVGTGDYLLIGAYVVYPDAETATTTLEDSAASTEGPGLSTVVGLPSTSFIGNFGPVTQLQVGPVLIWGFGLPPSSDVTASSGALQDLTRYQLQAMSFAVALLDHLNESTK